MQTPPDFFIDENLKEFVFPNAHQNNWKCTKSFFIEDDVCTIFLSKKKQRSITKEKPKSPPTPPQTPTTKAEKPAKQGTPKSPKVKSPPKSPPKSQPKSPKLELPKEIKEEPVTVIEESIVLPSKDDLETKENIVKFIFDDLQQFQADKENLNINIHTKYKHLNTKENIQDTFMDFANTCMTEYKSLDFKKLKVASSARLYSKLILGILKANQLMICTCAEFKKLREPSLQDVDDLKSLLQPFDIPEREILDVFSEKNVLLLVSETEYKLQGVIWTEAWDNSYEYEYLQVMKHDDLKEITSSLYVKALNTKKTLHESKEIKILLYCYILSEHQSKKYSTVFWKAPKVGEFPSIPELENWKEWFFCTPAFTVQEGIKKLPKQDASLETVFSNSVYLSSFKATTKGLRYLELCKKHKFVKEDYGGLWKDFQDKTIEITLKKKECYSNIYLSVQEYPKANDLMGYFVVCKELFQEKDKLDSLTAIEKQCL